MDLTRTSFKIFVVSSGVISRGKKKIFFSFELERFVLKDMSNEVWVEKYRPKSFSEFEGTVKQELEKLVNIPIEKAPHVIFCGPPGTGKNTAATLWLRNEYGDDYAKYVKWINASKDRGIEKIRQNLGATYSLDQKKPSVIVFDEGDKLTLDSQKALRRKLEGKKKGTIYVFLCNQLSKIILPLQSRTLKIFFPPQNSLVSLKKIVKGENVVVSTEALSEIIHVSEGDLRKSINLLYAAFLHEDKEISVETVQEVSQGVSAEDWKRVLSLQSGIDALALAKQFHDKGLHFPLFLKRIQESVVTLSKPNTLFILQLLKWQKEDLQGAPTLLLFESALTHFYEKIICHRA